MLLNEELSSMREVANSTLPDVLVRFERVLTPTGDGGVQEDWVPSGTLPCRFVPGRGLTTSGSELQGESAEIVLASDAQLPLESRVSVGGRVYAVRHVQQAGAWNVSRRARLERILEAS